MGIATGATAGLAAVVVALGSYASYRFATANGIMRDHEKMEILKLSENYDNGNFRYYKYGNQRICIKNKKYFIYYFNNSSSYFYVYFTNQSKYYSPLIFYVCTYFELFY